MKPSRVQVRDLMARIRGGARATERDECLVPGEPRPPLAKSPNLAHLNRHWVIEDAASADGPIPRSLLRALVPQRLRRFVKGVLRDFVLAVLEPYLLEEREFLAHLVNLLNETTARIDALAEDARDVAAKSDESRRRLLAELEALRARAEQLHEAIERRLESGAVRSTAGGRTR